MRTLRHDEQQLVGELERLPPRLRVAFAAACAERLLPAYISFSEQSGRGNPSELAAILQRLWWKLAGGSITADEVQAEIDACMALVPQESEGPWADEQPYAEDAAAAVAYALRCWQSGASEEAAWAARRTYEAIDHYVINRLNIDTNKPGAEDRVLSHPLVQAELMRQNRDLEELLGAVREADMMGVVARLRPRAKAEAETLFRIMS